MDVVVLQPECKDGGIHAQMLLEESQRRDGAALSNIERWLPQNLPQNLRAVL